MEQNCGDPAQQPRGALAGDGGPDVEISCVCRRRIRLIRKCKVQHKLYNVHKTSKTDTSLRVLRGWQAEFSELKSENSPEGNTCSHQSEIPPSAPNKSVQRGKPPRKVILKIQFEPVCLALNYQEMYSKKQKLKNTDLIIPGVKFVTERSMHSINSWEKALVIYQTHYSASGRCHFGLLLKTGSRLITFDGIPKLWPLLRVEKSYHWQQQCDTWSCGYRVLFWAQKIKQAGIDTWLRQNQLDEVQYDY